MDRQLAELDDESLKKHYSSTDFYEGYFQYYEESLEWYFDPELCENPRFDDYQRLVLYNHVRINTSFIRSQCFMFILGTAIYKRS